MKKFTFIAVLVFYSLATFGVSLNYFYCCGKLKEVTVKLEPPVNHNCPMKGDKDCCKNEKVDIKIASDQNVSQQVVFEPLILADAPGENYFEPTGDFDSNKYKGHIQSRPPPLSQPHLHVLNCSFLI